MEQLPSISSIRERWGKWGSAISLVIFSGIYISFSWDVLTGFTTEGLSAVDTASDVAFLAMTIISIGAAVFVIRATLAE